MPRRRAATRSIPGYGFLSENAAFARRCADAGIVFVGPSPEAIEAMGEKTSARRLATELGVPVVPGSSGPVESVAAALEVAGEVGYPVAVKASGGGGGIGFRVAADEEELAAALDAVRADGDRFFGNGTVYLERYFDDPRHVEIQVLGDTHGNLIQLGERDCSVQRRHQKLVEESPAPTVDVGLADRLSGYALELARAIGYTSAGTIEGLLVGGRVLLPRDEHAPPGRASRDRARDRASISSRSSSASPPACRSASGRRTSSSAVSRSSAGSTPRRRTGSSCRAPARSTATASRPARACGSTPASRREPS